MTLKNKSIEKEFLDNIEKIRHSGSIVIVEGKKDKKALGKLGVKNIIELNKKPLFEIIEDIAGKNKNCIILTDLDKKGRELYGKLNSGLQSFGVKVDNSFRKFLFKETKLRQIEGLENYFKTLNF
ncbi:toprim domain-containing protein [Candidatus Woesearchaeota archaeon]|nr:toprim domain-containing protein [Candidatus Woesearchaeota archaeon]